MKFGTWKIGLALAVGGTLAGCGSDSDVFQPQLSNLERLVETAAVGQIAGDDQLITSVTVVGDLDGDGIDDAILETQYIIPNVGVGTVGDGVYVLYGGKGASGKFDVATLPALTGANDGGSPGIAAIGDVDGDGLADFLVGVSRVPGCGNPQVVKNPGAPDHSGAYLVYGSHTRVTGKTALASMGALLQDATACTEASQVANLGDLDGDGKADFAINRQVVSSNAEPAVSYVFYGRGTRLTGTLDLAATADATITTGMPSIAPSVGVGDVDGDGHADFIVRANNAVVQYDMRLVRGSATRLSGSVALDTIAASQFPDDDVCGGGASMPIAAGLGDLDGDGIDDFSVAKCGVEPLAVIGAEQHVFYGRAGGFGAQIAPGAQDATIHISSGYTATSQVAGADLDGDGVRDLVVSEVAAKDYNGAVHVIRGTGHRLTGTVSPADGAITFVGMPQRGGQCQFFGPGCLAKESLGDSFGIGDLTGDHKPDLLINAPTLGGQPTLGLPGSVASHAYVVPMSTSNP